jgi:putative pyruvate formate lyase activating enzyme
MTKQSRRTFIESVSSLAVASLSPALPSLLAGCRHQARAASRNDPEFEPGYATLHRSGELAQRGQELWQLMERCTLCPRQCGAARLDGQTGFCQGTSQLVIASYHPHFGEERPLVGQKGSGAVFFSNCALRCVFCINWQISQGGEGEPQRLEDLAEMMLHLQRMGCHNINIVTPTHYSPHIVLALDLAAAQGLRLPLVYNTCGWERPEILRELDGIVDIYLPDFKYADGAMASKYSSGADTYPEITKEALLEMHLMPNRVSGTRAVIDWIAANLPKDTYVNIMSQYRPMYRARDYPKIARSLKRREYTEVVDYAKQAGLTNLDIQGMPWL